MSRLSVGLCKFQDYLMNKVKKPPNVYRPFLPWFSSSLLKVEKSPLSNFPCDKLGNQSVVSTIPHPPAFTSSYRCKFPFPCECPALVTHLVEVFSVSIHTDLNGDERPCDVYGSIRVVDNQDVVSILYDRSSDDPETISQHGNLSLIDGVPSYVTWGHGTTIMDLNLKDITHRNIVQGRLKLHDSETEEIEDCCDKLIKAVVQGDHGFAHVYYSKFLHAVTATVLIELFRKHDTSCLTVDVCGSIVAGYASTKLFCNSDNEIKYMKSSLFNQPPDQYVKAKVGTHISLSKCVLVVPAYSSLVIEADLRESDGVFASGSVEFPAHDCHDFHNLIDGERGLISVRVRWGNGLRIRGSKDIAAEAMSANEHDKAEILDFEQLISTSSPSRNTSTTSGADTVEGTELTEVFSVYVAGKNHEVSALCGMIKVDDYFFDPKNIYERNLCNPDLMTGGKTIASLEGHSAIIESCDFLIDLHLRDPVNDLDVCKGKISWALYICRDECSMFGTGLCSMFRGAHGYGVMHYMIFDEACQAVVEISFFSNDVLEDAVNIYGCIFASYSTYEYSTSYQRKYFRSRLFDKSQTESVQLTSNSRIPLSKTVVVVPTDASLVIELDLQAMFIGYPDDSLYGKEELEIDLAKVICRKVIG